MRINKFVALASGLSRRAADAAITSGRVTINGAQPAVGQTVKPTDRLMLDGQSIRAPAIATTIMFNKPYGYVCSREGQGSSTIYELLPPEYHALKPVGRLDRNSTGLLLLTNDGELANQLTHPRYAKTKIYEVSLRQHLEPLHQQVINDRGIMLEDGLSKLNLDKLNDAATHFRVTMQEGRNRQIRRTFAALGYNVTKLHRTHFGNYDLGDLGSGKSKAL